MSSGLFIPALVLTFTLTLLVTAISQRRHSGRLMAGIFLSGMPLTAFYVYYFLTNHTATAVWMAFGIPAFFCLAYWFHILAPSPRAALRGFIGAVTGLAAVLFLLNFFTYIEVKDRHGRPVARRTVEVDPCDSGRVHSRPATDENGVVHIGLVNAIRCRVHVSGATVSHGWPKEAILLN